MSTNVKCQTPVGEIEFILTANNFSERDSNLVLFCAPFEPKLPPTMAVDGCVVAICQFYAPQEVVNLKFSANWVDRIPPDCDSATGECLDAQSWETDDHIVLIGTEDFDCLSRRLLGKAKSDVEPFTNRGITVCLAKCQPKQLISLHILVAWNRKPEKVEASSWYAVDGSHDFILNQIKQFGKNWIGLT